METELSVRAKAESVGDIMVRLRGMMLELELLSKPTLGNYSQGDQF